MATRAPAPAAAAARAGAQAALGSRLGSDAAAQGGQDGQEQLFLPLSRSAAAAQLSARLGRFVPADAVDFLSRMLCWDPEDRMSAKEALTHPFLARHGVSAVSPASSESSSEGREEQQRQQEATRKQPQPAAFFEVSASAMAASASAAAAAAAASAPAPPVDVEAAAAPPPAAAPAFHLLSQEQQQQQLYERVQERLFQAQEQERHQEREQQQQGHRYTFYCRAEPSEAVRIDHWTPRRQAEAEAAAAYARGAGIGGGGGGGGGGLSAAPTAEDRTVLRQVVQEAEAAGFCPRIRAHRGSDGPIVLQPVPSRASKAAVAFPREEEGEKQQWGHPPFAAGAPSSSSAFPPPFSMKSALTHHHQQRQERLPRPQACPRADSDLAGAASALRRVLGDVQSSSMFAALGEDEGRV